MKNASEEIISYADKLLNTFNETFTILYGEENVSFIVHAFLHLAMMFVNMDHLILFQSFVLKISFKILKVSYVNLNKY